MALHDTYARVTPYELAFRDAERAASLLASVEEEAEGRGADVEDLTGFLTLGSVDAFVREIAGDEGAAGALHRFGPLAFHGVHFVKAGSPVYLMSTHVARYLVEGTPDGAPRPPAPSGYLQLPQHLFWTGAAGDVPESIDGVFWTATVHDVLHALLVTGVRPDRPGVGVVPLPAAPLDDASRWLDLQARPDGADFEADLPGAEIDRLYGIETAGELFKLLGRFFAYVEGTPEALTRAASPEEPSDDEPRPSALSFTRVSLEA